MIICYSQSVIADEQQKAFISFGCITDYSLLSSSGGEKLSGFDIELIKTIADTEGFQASAKDGTRAEMLQMLQNGEVDAVSGIVMTQSAEDYFDFSIPYLTEYYSIFIPADSSCDEVEDLTEYVCACPEGDPVIDTFIIPNKLHKNMVEASSYYNAFELVHRGAADYVIAPARLGHSLTGEFGMKVFELYERSLMTFKYRFAVKKGSSCLFLINEALSAASGQGVIASLKNNTGYFEQFPVSARSIKLPRWSVVLIISMILAVNLIIYIILNKRHEHRLQQVIDELEISEMADVQNVYADECKDSVDEMSAKLEQMFSELSLKAVEIERLKITDGSTLLYNHSYLERRIRDEIERYRMYGQKFCVISLNLTERCIDAAVTASRVVLDIIRRSDAAGYNGNGVIVIILPKTNRSQAEELLRKISFGLVDKVVFSGIAYELPVDPGINLPPEIEELCIS